ncbi:MAG: hypothetical protein JXD19_12350 [Deltaproteobacteria bacterium]|nr:hypothetical protein [Deltaproteobacteria bacterium]
MIKSGISHMLCFMVSLIVGNALLLLLEAYFPLMYAFFLRFGQAVALLFKISYSQKIMAAFVMGTILSLPMGMLFHKLFKLGR